MERAEMLPLLAKNLQKKTHKSDIQAIQSKPANISALITR
jgi:hypothetical protein